MPAVHDAPEPFTLSRPGGGTLHGLVDLPAAPGRRPAVVICHGFKGFMEWGFFPPLAHLLAERGFVAVRFNLSGAGMLPGDERVTDPAAFRANTHGAELQDLLRILEATAGGEIAAGRIDGGRLGLLGHSRGGGAAILAAARPEWRDRIRALVTWAAIARVDRYGTEDKERWRREGELEVVNSRTGQRLALGTALLDDIEAHGESHRGGSLDILTAAGRRTAPWLIVHGEEDETVPAAEARELAAAAAPPSELLLIPRAGHTFGARHPFAGPTPFLIQALNATQTWFRRHLALPLALLAAVPVTALLAATLLAGAAWAQEPSPAPAGGTEASAEEPVTVFPHTDPRLWVAGQVNFIYQANLPFHAPYTGPQSLQPRAEERLSRVLSLYFGLQLWHGAEALVDFESAGGRGISDAFGLAGFTNLDVVRNPELGDTPYLARAMLHQTWALGTAMVDNDRGPTSSALKVPADRVDLWIGKFGTVDFFDVNDAGGDSHLQFLNWTVDQNGAFDYAADTRGYTYGAVAELRRGIYSLRAGIETMPKVANGIDLDNDLTRARGQNVEGEVRPVLGGRQGAVRLLVYQNVADMGSYREAIDRYLAGLTPVPDIVATRRQGRTKTGAGLNFEQEVTAAVRVFGRWGWNDGRNESFAYTEVDSTVELGADLRLDHERHKAGIALVSNGISGLHRTYLALGGLGFLLGDGRLTYGREDIVESYYTYRIWRGVYVSADLQHVTNPGYNRDRGPVWVPASRLHIDF